MKKISMLVLVGFLLTGCAAWEEFRDGRSEKNYQAKIAEYRQKAPEGYDFSVNRYPPYELYDIYYRVIQVLGDHEVLACVAYQQASSYESWKIGRCINDQVRHLVVKNKDIKLYDDAKFFATYYKENELFTYQSVTGAKKTVQSFDVL